MEFIAFFVFIVTAIFFGAGLMWIFNGTDRGRIGDSKFGVYLLLLSLLLAIIGVVLYAIA